MLQYFWPHTVLLLLNAFKLFCFPIFEMNVPDVGHPVVCTKLYIYVSIILIKLTFILYEL